MTQLAWFAVSAAAAELLLLITLLAVTASLLKRLRELTKELVELRWQIQRLDAKIQAQTKTYRLSGGFS